MVNLSDKIFWVCGKRWGRTSEETWRNECFCLTALGIFHLRRYFGCYLFHPIICLLSDTSGLNREKKLWKKKTYLQLKSNIGNHQAYWAVFTFNTAEKKIYRQFSWKSSEKSTDKRDHERVYSADDNIRFNSKHPRLWLPSPVGTHRSNDGHQHFVSRCRQHRQRVGRRYGLYNAQPSLHFQLLPRQHGCGRFTRHRIRSAVFRRFPRRSDNAPLFQYRGIAVSLVGQYVVLGVCSPSLPR